MAMLGLDIEAPKYKLDVNGSARFQDNRLVEVSIAGFFILLMMSRTTLHIAPKNDVLRLGLG